MTRNKLYIGIIITIAVYITSCEKVVDVEPEFTKERSQLFTSLTDYEYALTGAYSLLRQTGYFGSGGQTTSTWANLPDFMADNLVQTSEDLGNWAPQVNWVYAADETDLAVAWQAAYSVIRQANIVLNGIDKFSTTELTLVNKIKGQALAIRGMAHFDVLRFWGVEYDRNSAALGVPYVTSEDKDILPGRLTVKATYDSILADMLSAETLLGNITGSINTATNRTAIDRTGVRALLARIYLYAKDYVKAEEYATLAITAMPLAASTAFGSIWKDESQVEVLWAVSFNAGEGTPSVGVHIASSNRNRFRPSLPLTALYDQANDVRFVAYFASRQSGNVTPPRPVLAYSGNTRKIFNKFITRGTTLDNVVNWKVARTGEMYLIRAEARALQGGKEALGLADLNNLRAARINGYIPVILTGQALTDAIQTERRKELVGEGHRWFDLRRTTKMLARADFALASTKLTLAPTAREWVWPVPQEEIDANAKISVQQTPGY